MSGTRPDEQASFCAVLCDEWGRAGVSDAVIAPGSRSTPLVEALAAQDRIRLHVVLDERSAGFVGLGLGLATGRPAVVVTTSGTASVELHPAVVEAAQAGVPMIAATADRPPELHQVGAPQTVDQQGLFGRAVRWAVDGGVVLAGAPASWRSVASRTVIEAVSGVGGPGPVHLNLPFRDPLLGVAPTGAGGPGRAGGRPWHEPATGRSEAPERTCEWLASFAGRRGIVVAGQGALTEASGPPRRMLDAAAALGWPVLADPRSGFRVDHPVVVSGADALLRVPEVAAWVPDLVVRLGAPWASKVLGQWLAGLPPEVPQVAVDLWARWADPDRNAWVVLAAEPSGLIERVAAIAARCRRDRAASPDWPDRWSAVERAAQEAIGASLDAGGPLEMSEPAVARAAMAGLPDGGQLVVASSMPVRDVEWFGGPRSGLTVLANRGANGIDGVLSTAVGAALAAGRPTVALLGDLAFVYDASALLWARGSELALKVLVVDNDGGGIFSFLPQAAALPHATFERFWGTPHGVDLVAVAAAYGAVAQRIGDRRGLDRFLSFGGGPRGVEVGVVGSHRGDNVAHHDRINAAVAEAVRRGGVAPGTEG